MNDLSIPAWISCQPQDIPAMELTEPPEHAPSDLNITVIEELLPFLDGHRYKVAHGGRGSSKSWGIARMLIARAYSNRERILCCRELQTSIEESVLTLLENQISLLGLTKAFEIQAKKITCLTTGSVFLFEGLKSNVTKIRSMEGITLVWAEEAEKISKTSWDVLIPTIRMPNSEIWISFNPDDDLDETWLRFVEDPPPDTYVTQVNYHANPWFPDVLRKEMDYCRNKSEDDYDHIWLGKPRKAMLGAYYATEMTAAAMEGRIGNVPHDPAMPVQVSFDLGMADSMVLWFAQRSGPAVHIIDCWEFKGTRLEIIIKKMIDSDYIISQVILPHDGRVRGMISGLRRIDHVRSFGFEVTEAPSIHDGVGVDDGIRTVKSFLPRCYFDKAKCQDGIKALKRYRTKYNEARKVFDNKPLHDWCFTGDTLISTGRGDVRIDEVVVGDHVLLNGQEYPVTHTHDNGYKPTVDVILSNGAKLTCTKDHKVFTTRGIVPVSELCYHDEILTDKEDITSWLQNSRGIKEAFTGCIKGSSIDYGLSGVYIAHKQTTNRPFSIGSFGLMLMETFHICLLSFLCLVTGRTSMSITGSADQGAKMESLLEQNTLVSSLATSGTIKTQELDITTTPQAADIRPCYTGIFTKTLTALEPLRAWISITKILIRRTIRSPTSKRCHVVSICDSTGSVSRVYDLTVAHQHAYYANGILASNCSDFADSFRYLAITAPRVEFGSWDTEISYNEASKHI